MHTVLHILSGDLWGGSEAQMLHQLKGISKLGVSNIHVLLFNPGKTQDRYQQAGLSCHIANESFGFMELKANAQQIVKEVSPDLIVAHGYKESILAALLCRKSHRQWISTLHGKTENYPGLRGIKSRFFQKILLFLAKHSASRFVLVSNELRKSLGLEKANYVSIIRNVFAPTRETAALEKKESDKKKKIVVVGRLVPVKRVDRAIKAFAKSIQDSKSPATLQIIGEGPLKEELTTLVKTLKLEEQIEFLGFREDASELIKKADILLMSSDSEGIPTVLLEAIYGGTSVVATSVGGIPEVFQDVPNHPHSLAKIDVASLSAALSEILSKDPQSEEFQKSRKEFDQHFTPTIAAKKHQQLYLEVLANSKAS